MLLAMEQDIAINRVLRDLKMQGLIAEEESANVRFFLNALWVASWEARGSEFGDRRSREIIQLDKKGRPLNEFHNSMEAAKKLRCARKTIRKSLLTGKPTDRGHLWKYVENEDTRRSDMD